MLAADINSVAGSGNRLRRLFPLGNRIPQHKRGWTWSVFVETIMGLARVPDHAPSVTG